MIRSVFLFALVFLSFSCMAQKKAYTTEKTAKPKLLDAFRKGQRLSFNGQSDAAIKELEKVLKNEPRFIDAQIEWANVKNQQGKYDEAELGYEKALAIAPDYIAGVLYSLGIVEFDQEKFAEASQHFEAYLKTGKASSKRQIAAKAYLGNARFAAEALSNPVPFEPINLGPSINTAEHEYLPTLTADGEKLVYTAVRGRQEDFYISGQTATAEWSKGQPIVAVNSEYNEGAQSISADGKFLAFTICNRPKSFGRCDLYFTEYIDGAWTPVQNMGSPINSAAYESLPSISADGKLLYFTCDKKGGSGGLDIWYSLRNTDGTWGTPKNIGAPINTKRDEQAPFIHPDGQSLYFMSKGHPGMGEYDLYLSRKQPDGTWGEPQNLGYPINTKGNEGAFTVSLDGQTAYYASDMKGGFGKTDIYSFELPEAVRPQPVTYVKAIVSDAIDRKKLSAGVEFIDLSTGQSFIRSVTDKDGEFLITLPMGKDYALNVSKEKYLFYSANFSLKDPSTLDKPYALKIELTPVPTDAVTKVSKPVILKNVFFETGSVALRDESLAELDRLKELLIENPNLKIQINGHTDNVGADADNLQLSEGRAKSVYDYLIMKNIDAARLKYKGFGETKPIASNETAIGRKENRRTEFEVF